MSSSRRTRREDDGFTLVELMVAFGLLMIVLLASLPAFLGMLRTSVTTKVQTQAKNLNQQRLEQLKDLSFHIDRQNGPFLDLLDIYYTNASTAGTTTTVTVDGLVQSGVYVPTAAATGGAPAGPFYRVTVTRTLAGKAFTQNIYTQFLGPDGLPLSMTTYQNLYDSQVAGQDASPSGAVGITIITSWLDGTKTKTLASTTRIVDGRPEAAVIQTQARATAVQISSTGADGATLQLNAGVATADGSQSSGSSVAGFATGAQALRTGVASVTGKATSFDLPITAATTVNDSGPQTSGGSCSWFGFASTGVDNGTGSVDTGLPKAPSNVDSTSPPTAMAGYISANGGGSCGLLSYDNLAGGGLSQPTSPNTAIGYEMGAAPYVRAPDNVSGSGPVIAGTAYVTSSDLTASPQKSTAGASAKATQPVNLFPNSPEAPAGKGLVSMRLVDSALTCNSSTTSGSLGVTTAAYTFELGWWGKGPTETGTAYNPVWHTTTWTYSSTTNSAPVRSGPAWDPENTLLANGMRLSQLIASPAGGAAPAALTTGSTSGHPGLQRRHLRAHHREHPDQRAAAGLLGHQGDDGTAHLRRG